jgi:hypothetical protein
LIAVADPTAKDVDKSKEAAKQQEAVPETSREAKFEPDFSKFNLKSAITLRETLPAQIESQPLVQVAKTAKCLLKLLSIRLN